MLLRAAARLSAGRAALPLSAGRAALPVRGARALSDGIHDDFKPKVKRAYASEAGNIHEQIDKDIKENPVVVFMKGFPDSPMCGFSNAVVQVMKAEGVEFKGFNVLQSPDLREGIKTYSNWPTIPQVYVNGEFIGGRDTTIEMYKSRVRARARAPARPRPCLAPLGAARPAAWLLLG